MFNLCKLNYDDLNEYRVLLPQYLKEAFVTSGEFIKYEVYGCVSVFGLIGIVVGRIYGDCFSLFWINIHQDFRSLGVGSQVISDLKSHLVEKGIKRILVQFVDIPSSNSLKTFFGKNDFVVSNGGWAAIEFSNAKILLIPTVKKGVKVSSNYQLTPLAQEDLFNDPTYKAIINRDGFLSNFCLDGASAVLCPASSIILKREGRVVGWIGSIKISPCHYKLSPLFLLPSEPQILGIKLTSFALDKIQKMDSAPSAIMIASSGNPSAAKLIYSLKEYSSKVYNGSYAYKSISKG